MELLIVFWALPWIALAGLVAWMLVRGERRERLRRRLEGL